MLNNYDIDTNVIHPKAPFTRWRFDQNGGKYADSPQRFYCVYTTTLSAFLLVKLTGS